jgi:hypothetical protein
MEDLYLDEGLKAEDLRSYLEQRLSLMPKDSIVRLRAQNSPAPEVKAALTHGLLKEVLPETMNYQLSGSVTGAGWRRKKSR